MAVIAGRLLDLWFDDGSLTHVIDHLIQTQPSLFKQMLGNERGFRHDIDISEFQNFCKFARVTRSTRSTQPILHLRSL